MIKKIENLIEEFKSEDNTKIIKALILSKSIALSLT